MYKNLFYVIFRIYAGSASKSSYYSSSAPREDII